MKSRLLWGFALAFVVLIAVVGTAFYVTVYRPTQAVMADLKQLADLRALNANLADTTAFTPPPGDLLTADQVERFARVQASMAAELGSDYPVLRERAMTLEGLVRDEPRGGTGDGGTAAKPGGTEVRSHSVRVKDAILAFRGLGPVLRSAKEAQIHALNREGFSMGEYRWIRESVYRALGFSHVSRYFEDYAAMNKPEEVPKAAPVPDLPEGPSANRDLVAPVGSRAEDWFPFLVFGL